jgi:hypothetical protein
MDRGSRILLASQQQILRPSVYGLFFEGSPANDSCSEAV